MDPRGPPLPRTKTSWILGCPVLWPAGKLSHTWPRVPPSLPWGVNPTTTPKLSRDCRQKGGGSDTHFLICAQLCLEGTRRAQHQPRGGTLHASTPPPLPRQLPPGDTSQSLPRVAFHRGAWPLTLSPGKGDSAEDTSGCHQLACDLRQPLPPGQRSPGRGRCRPSGPRAPTGPGA